MLALERARGEMDGLERERSRRVFLSAAIASWVAREMMVRSYSDTPDSEVTRKSVRRLLGALTTRGSALTERDGLKEMWEIICRLTISWRAVVQGLKEGQISACPKTFGSPHLQTSSALGQRVWWWRAAETSLLVREKALDVARTSSLEGRLAGGG
jgi:hypothetical protein